MRKRSSFYSFAMQMLQLKAVFITTECSINYMDSLFYIQKQANKYQNELS